MPPLDMAYGMATGGGMKKKAELGKVGAAGEVGNFPVKSGMSLGIAGVGSRGGGGCQHGKKGNN